MKTLNYLLLLTVVSSVIACQGTDREIIREQIVSPTPKWGAPEARAEGGVDSGGGNGLDGRMLESYKQNLQAIALFQQYVLPIIGKVAENSSRFASDLVHISRERSWYFIPGRLDRLPSQRIGVSLKTDQYALQNRSEVWIDQSLFDAMKSDEERAKLILHELVMGIRMMAFQDSLDDCLSRVALQSLDDSKESPYPKLRKLCFQGTEIPGLRGGSLLPRKIDNTNEEYMVIRQLVNTLWETQGAIDGQELHSWLKVKNFRQYKELEQE